MNLYGGINSPCSERADHQLMYHCQQQLMSSTVRKQNCNF